MKREDFNEIISRIKKDDVNYIKGVLRTESNLEDFYDDSKFNIVFYSCLFSAKKCINLLLDNNYDFIKKNKNGICAFDLLYLNYEDNFVNENDLNEYSLKLKDNINRNNLQNVLALKIYSCLTLNDNNYIKKLIPILDLQKTFGVHNFSIQGGETFYHFIYLAYHFNNIEFFKLLVQNNIKLSSEIKEEIKKMSLIENKSEWIPIIDEREVYKKDSVRVVNMVSEILAFQ